MSSISGLTSTAATFECWMKMSTAAGVAGNPQALVTLANELNNGLNSPQLAYSHYDMLMVTWGGDTYYSADTRPVSDGAWHHVAVVFDHGYVMIYKDGVVTADLSGVASLIASSVYAGKFPSRYRDAPKAPGLVLSANVFGNTSAISELLLLLLNPWNWGMVVAVVKVLLYTLGFAANVLGLVDS
jgi:hypothetical protein